MARSGRNASGRAAASSRRMVTASWIAASASSRRPRSASRSDRLVSDAGQVGPERVRAGRGQLPVDGRRLPGWRPAPPPAAPGRARPADRLFSDWPGRAGTRPGGPRPAPGRGRRLPGWRPARPPAAPGRPARPTGCSATGQVGPERVRAGRGQLPVEAAASWLAASASSRRPRSASRTDRLFSDPARSGRNASGRAAASSR